MTAKTNPKPETTIRAAYEAGYLAALSLAVVRIRAYEGAGADDAIREIEEMAKHGPEEVQLV